MYSRILRCVATLVLAAFTTATTSWADFEVTSDYTLDASNALPPGSGYIHVRNDAVLTIQNGLDGTPPAVGHIYLHDTASLVVNGGVLRGKIGAWGDNQIEFLGGDFNDRVLGDGNLRVVANRLAKVNGSFRFSGGTQGYEFRSFVGNPSIFMGPGDSLDSYSATPEFFHRADSGLEMYHLRHFGVDTALGALKVYPDEQVYPDGADFNWRIHDTTGRPDGDADLDGDVDLDDLNIVRNSFGSPNNYGQGYSSKAGDSIPFGDTLPFDGRVDLDDLNRIRNAFGSVASVPEPHSASILAVSVILLSAISLATILRRRVSRVGVECPEGSG